MAGRKPKGYELDLKIEKYLETYELDDLNQANDMASLRQLAQYEIIIENLQDELAGIKKVGEDAKKVKDLNAALNDAINSYTSLQKTLGIDRNKRASESDESVLSYVEKLQKQAEKMWSSRLRKLVCKKCNLPLGKFYVYITEKGEEGSIEADKKQTDKIKFSFKVECSRCGDMIEISDVTADEREVGAK